MAKKKRRKGETEAERNRESQAKEQNKILKGILIIIAFVVVGFFLFVVVSKPMANFDYKGVEFKTVKFCDSGPPCLVTYQTTLPVRVQGKNISLSSPSQKTNDYNFYLRSDPRKLDVDFIGIVTFKENMILNFHDNFVCEGNGAIAASNLIQLYNILGVRLLNDKNATCDALGRYSIVNVVPGNETKIEHFYPACYTITIKECEILEGTEKFMIETFVEVNKALKNAEN